jgi:soluble lytic murein transglycosylase-like protein
MLNRESLRATWGGRLRVFYLGLACIAAFLASVHANDAGRMFERGVVPRVVETSEEGSGADLPKEQRAVVEFIAKRYHVAETPLAEFVATAFRSGREMALDPLLILAVIAVESRFNPVAQSEFGALGLMQVIPKYHADKLQAVRSQGGLLDPEVNIQVGAAILREYLKRFGEVETALQMYGGAFDEPTSLYAGRVLAERNRLDQVIQRARKLTKQPSQVS